MRHYDIPALRTFQTIFELLIQLIKFTGIFLIICFIIITVPRISLYQSIPDILHFLLCTHRIKPDMRIFSFITMSMIMSSIQKLHTIRCLRHNQILILQSIQYTLRPVLQICTIIDKYICILKIPDIRCRRLPVMRLRSRRNHILYLDPVAPYLPCKIIHGIKAGHHLQSAILHKWLSHRSGPVQTISGHTAHNKKRHRQNCCRCHLPSVNIHFLSLLQLSQYP